MIKQNRDNTLLMERSVRWKFQARCGAWEKMEIVSKSYV